jgi:hypothetical protein
MKNIKVLSGSTREEAENRHKLYDLFKNTPIPSNELLNNLGLYINRQNLSRILFMAELYSRFINIHGVIMEFGVRWGQNLALFSALRGIYEPFNYNRKIIGFDTFSGFPGVDEKDGTKVKEGDYCVSSEYENYLENLLSYHESESPISHKKKFDLIKGDAVKNIDRYFAKHPETIIAFAYFDFDIYKPTKKCLETILPRLPKGAVIAFDELNCPEFPGETLALMEVIGINNIKLQRSPLNPLISYIIME